MFTLLGSEWGHNLAHAYAAKRVGRPMDELRVLWGMPRCIYHDINDPGTNPREHILRAMGGPLFNLCVIPLAWLGRKIARKGTRSRYVADVALSTNVFLSMVSLLPIPGIDGGPIVKWSLVERGATVQEADEVVRKVDGLLGLLLSLVSMIAFKKKRNLVGIASLSLSVLSFGIFCRRIKENQAPF